ncbi:MAG TPA: ABC transporter ATP-binding protein [Polyangia bacterium]|jgi:multiple sugar transport system ATP-binding protein|nr:ABC transporter ATP-binding protein [Polyangia bacterium]
MSQLHVENITKRYGDNDILRGIDISVDSGQCLILVGPSGCGKSTLMNIIAGLDRPSGGRVHIGGRDVTDVAPKDRDIAMVFQSYALYPTMNVRQNLAFGLATRRVPKPQQAIEVARVAKTLRLEALLDRKPSQLSGGQRQRVAMGRALARDPKLFLFDEPLSNLDAQLRVEMRTEIKVLHQRLGTTMVYVTHDQIEAMTLGDRIAVMKDGVIQQVGTPRDIYDRPANTFVAAFIGSPSMCFLPCTLELFGGKLGVTLASASTRRFWPLPSPPAAAQAGQRVIVGVRPEQLNERDDGLPCRVDVCEPTGPDTLVYVKINDVICTARLSPRAQPRPGDDVRLQPDLALAVLFDPATGQRLPPAN